MTHETNYFVYFYIDSKAVLLFKSGWWVNLIPLSHVVSLLCAPLSSASATKLEIRNLEEPTCWCEILDRVSLLLDAARSCWHCLIVILPRIWTKSHHQRCTKNCLIYWLVAKCLGLMGWSNSEFAFCSYSITCTSCVFIWLVYTRGAAGTLLGFEVFGCFRCKISSI